MFSTDVIGFQIFLVCSWLTLQLQMLLIAELTSENVIQDRGRKRHSLGGPGSQLPTETHTDPAFIIAQALCQALYTGSLRSFFAKTSEIVTIIKPTFK